MNSSAESDEQAVEEPKLEDVPAEEPAAVSEPVPGDFEVDAAAAETPPEPGPELVDPVEEAHEAAPMQEAPLEPSEEAAVDLPATMLKYVAFDEEDGDEEAAEARSPSPLKKQQRQSSRSPRKNQPTLRQVTNRFAACGRCSYFWAGYRVIFGLMELETAVAQSKSGWLELIWNEQMPELIHKSYGVRFDIAYFHYDACCDECRRHFIYQAAEKEDEADAFRIEISPRMAQ